MADALNAYRARRGGPRGKLHASTGEPAASKTGNNIKAVCGTNVAILAGAWDPRHPQACGGCIDSDH